jgi:Domain of unknown function (DUF4292)
VVLTMSMTACKIIGKRPARPQVTTQKNADSVQVTAPVAATPEQAPATISLEKKQLINTLMPLWTKQIDFNTFSGKAKMHYEGKSQKNEFTAHIRISKDKVIWVSVTAFLIQVARVYITPDSIHVINYLNREAFVMPMADANKLLPAPVDFGILQNFIVGNALKSSTNATDATDFGGSWTLQVDEPGMMQQATYNKADSTMRTLQIRTPDNRTQGVIQYGNYEMIDERKFADNRAVNLNNNGEQYYMDMNFNNVEFNKQLDFPFSIPKNYKVK